MKIVSHEAMDNPHVSQIASGKHDGLVFTSVVAQVEDGTYRMAWLCPEMPGYWKVAFVPWDLNHKDLIG